MGGCRDYSSSSADRLDFGDPTTFDGSSKFCWGAWQNFNSLTANKGIIFTKSDGVTGIFNLFSFTTLDVQGGCIRTNSTETCIFATNDDAPTLFTTGQWYFVCFAWESGVATAIYIDGSSVSITTNEVGAPYTLPNLTQNAVVGNFDSSVADVAMDGKMAYTSAYNEFLIEEQIKELLHNPFCVFSGALFMAPGWNVSADNEIDIVGGLSGTPTTCAESFDGPPVGMLYQGMCQ